MVLNSELSLHHHPLDVHVFFMTQWVLLVGLTVGLVKVCLQGHGHLASGYTTQESLSPIHHYLQINPQEAVGLSPFAYCDRVLTGPIIFVYWLFCLGFEIGSQYGLELSSPKRSN